MSTIRAAWTSSARVKETSVSARASGASGFADLRAALSLVTDTACQHPSGVVNKVLIRIHVVCHHADVRRTLYQGDVDEGTPVARTGGDVIDTEHSVKIGVDELRYTARVRSIAVTGPGGEELGQATTYAYVLHETHAAARPVMFLFNGGPGASSVWLHLGGLGPRRVAVPTDLSRGDQPPYLLEDSPATLLQTADLVFIDPLATGHSRAVSQDALARVRTLLGDAQQFATIVSEWLHREGRLNSPVYVLGESYGTLRAPYLAKALLRGPVPITLSGIVLLGQALNVQETRDRPGNVVHHLAALPFQAATAWYHGKGSANAACAEEAARVATDYAFGDYATALLRGSRLPAAQQAQAAARLEDLTGICAAVWQHKRLRLRDSEFRKLVLQERNAVIGSSDSRYTGEAEDEAASEGSVDPSYTRIAPAFAASIGNYLREELGSESEVTYAVGDPDAAPAWQWYTEAGSGAFTTGPSPFDVFPYVGALSQYLKDVTGCRLFVGTGLYDSLTTTGAAHHLVTQYELPAARVVEAWYDAGHMMYSDPASATKLQQDLASFIAPTTFED